MGIMEPADYELYECSTPFGVTEIGMESNVGHPTYQPHVLNAFRRH